MPVLVQSVGCGGGGGVTLTMKESRRICREYGLSRNNVKRLQLRDGVALDALLVLINSVLRNKAAFA